MDFERICVPRETAERRTISPFDWIYFRGQQGTSHLVWKGSWEKRNGGSPRIYAGELGFQAERLAWDLFSSGFSRGFSAACKAVRLGQVITAGLKPRPFRNDCWCRRGRADAGFEANAFRSLPQWLKPITWPGNHGGG